VRARIPAACPRPSFPLPFSASILADTTTERRFATRRRGLVKNPGERQSPEKIFPFIADAGKLDLVAPRSLQLGIVTPRLRGMLRNIAHAATAGAHRTCEETQ
jgi:hypothetical protein